MAQARNTHQRPNGEQPSGWPGTNPALNIRDEYDRIEAERRQQREQERREKNRGR
ncbi:hypothetical protein GT755_38345 [Herbidospora sp. NEAU-GS84]|uniref:Uncharacterized protein n=1 Tax=Herbidospora solisilvae TaxID=2696284 RepID=A0A7C9NTJ3_9ACTN|nr:hypothetical protein [Herbidospora solisilvae]NAS27516.1 hypothetical protein [Herbidospora solisilvae]